MIYILTWLYTIYVFYFYMAITISGSLPFSFQIRDNSRKSYFFINEVFMTFMEDPWH